jgi:hypothetical protein
MNLGVQALLGTCVVSLALVNVKTVEGIGWIGSEAISAMTLIRNDVLVKVYTYAGGKRENQAKS